MNTQRYHSNGICYLAPDVAIPSPRGSSVHVIELAEGLAELGYDVHVICRRLRRDDPATEKLGNITTHRLYRWIIAPEARSSFKSGTGEVGTSASINWIYYFYLLTIFRLYAAIAAARIIKKYDLRIILERETSFGAGALASYFCSTPMILEIVGPRYSRMSVRRSSRILYYTESMLRDWVNKEKCIAVPAGVNLSIFREDRSLGLFVRRKLEIPNDHFVVGYVGTFQTWHGVDTFLYAIKDIVSNQNNIKALFVGPSFEKYERMAEGLHILDYCKFTGPVRYEDVPGYINACDIMTAPYNPQQDKLRKEYGIGWPLKILEYMACGKCVISTRVKPIDSIIRDESLGYTIQPGDYMGLAQTIESLICDRQMLERIATKAKLLVEENYSWTGFAKTVSSIIESIE